MILARTLFILVLVWPDYRFTLSLSVSKELTSLVNSYWFSALLVETFRDRFSMHSIDFNPVCFVIRWRCRDKNLIRVSRSIHTDRLRCTTRQSNFFFQGFFFLHVVFCLQTLYIGGHHAGSFYLETFSSCACLELKSAVSIQVCICAYRGMVNYSLLIYLCIQDCLWGSPW